MLLGEGGKDWFHIFFYFGQVACIIVLPMAYLVGLYTLALWVNQ